MDVLELIPTEEEVGKWIVSSVNHCFNVEFYLEKLNINYPFIQRPHDLEGEGNKLSWPVIKGFALQYREPKVDFNTYIQPALELHRKQHHHRMWNGDEVNPNATKADLELGGLDSACSLLEPRDYQGGVHDYRGAEEIAKKNPKQKVPYILWAIDKIEHMENPNLNAIKSINNIPNTGLNQPMYEAIVKRTNEAVEMLRSEHGYVLNI
ncbi:MAG: hypothetical protein ABIF85_07520 [Nanoarchaeota archaeon]|nr:hypothetical protein [Nanoarchaeota archaeon]MBU4300927.1 hypothetical protein [Nanoarchaeota archaeon]MBU4451528.1 hypothetical protein [Nanoarchaeota archaeon]MCG2723273.1 hypothetical protein [archaeon]